MTKIEKFWYLIGPIILSFTYSATIPIINIYFISLVSPRVLAISNLLGTALSAFVNWSVPKAHMKEWYRKHFLGILLIDIICFYAISFFGYEYPAARFLGFAVLNAVSTCIWVMIMRNAVNKIIIDGDKRTDFEALSEYTCRIACFCGAIVAIIFTEIPVEYCIIAQCVANSIMGITDYYSFVTLNKTYKLENNSQD